MLIWFLKSLILIFLGLGAVAFITLLERKFLGLSQVRLGPNKVSLFGLLQPVADGVKLLWKELFLIMNSQSILFFLSPILLMLFFILLWTWILPWFGSSSYKYSSLIYFSFLGLGAYSVILTGWSSTSGFSKLGGMRGMLQSLSYEVALILLFLVVLSSFKSFIMKSEESVLMEYLIIWLIIWLIISLMETNRAPFDLLEGESELISGFNVELGSISFVYLFLSEYGMIMVMSLIASIPFSSEVGLNSMMFISFLLFMRSCFPRVRYDVMMSVMWQAFLPLVVLLYLISTLLF